MSKARSSALDQTKSYGLVAQVSATRGELDAAIKAQKSQRGDDVEEKIAALVTTEHLMDNEEALAFHQSNEQTGLTEKQVLEKREEFGLNRLTPPEITPWYILFFRHLTGFFSLLLWVAGVLCFIAYAVDSDTQENLYLGVVLVTVVILTGCFSYYQDAKSAAVMAGFQNFLPPESHVIREGKGVDLGSVNLVPGDIVSIQSGDKIPADLRVLSFTNLKVDNSSLTGESEPQKRTTQNVEKSPLEATNLMFYGTLCVEGKCQALVIATGDRTTIGRIAELATKTKPKPTPISIEIDHFIHIVSGVAIFLGVTFLIINFIKGTDAVDNMVFCIGIIVANVPEGLLATVTVSLTLTAKRMASKKVLVKNLEAVETLGSTTVIASDKTGTLTQNRMSATHLYFDNKVRLAHSFDSGAMATESGTFRRLCVIAGVCNGSVFRSGQEERPLMQRETTGGNASDAAFLKFVEQVVAPAPTTQALRDQHSPLANLPFSSANKYMASVVMNQNDPKKPRILLLKGAPERVFNRCDTIMVNGKPAPITEAVKAKYAEAMRSFMFNGERVIGFATADLDPKVFHENYEYNTEKPNFPLEKGEGLSFVGLLSLTDPPRPSVPASVLLCIQAGIKVVMVTGDHPDTAAAIAKMVHIIRDPTRREVALKRGVDMKDVDWNDPEVKAIVVTGAELAEFDEERLQAVLDYDQIVFARTSPKQKLDIVQGLQTKRFVRRGYPADAPMPVRHVVAVTGDGVNDSPALKAANIGVAMGIEGSDVAKEAADMILLNDNFASIVDGVEEGRLIFDNLKKSIAYTLSSNIPEISPFLIFILVNIPLPLPTVLILCIDLGTDMLPAISLAYELKEANIMSKPPRDMRVDRLVTVKLISFSYFQIGVIQAAAGFYAYMVVLNDYGFPPNILPGLGDDFEDGKIVVVGADTFVEYEGSRTKLSKCHINRVGVCHNLDEALAHAQCAFFISIIIVQWADIMCCKTRSLSLYQQGMRNQMLNFGLFFETTLGAALCYIEPLNDPLGTRDLEFVHWLPALPFFIIILTYDEIRKYLMRNLGKGNWFEVNTYY